MNVALSVSGSGALDTEDRRAALMVIQRRNSLIADAIPPIPPLPTGTAAEIRASYITLLNDHMNAFHANNVAQSKTPEAAVQAGLTPDQLKEITGAVIDRIQAGTPYATVLADVQS